MSKKKKELYLEKFELDFLNTEKEAVLCIAIATRQRLAERDNENEKNGKNYFVTTMESLAKFCGYGMRRLSDIKKSLIER
jgi:hypothetical protein